MFTIPLTWKELRQQLQDPFYKNSFYILVTSIISSLIGFIFWFLAAKYYDANTVGLCTAMVSSVNLIALVAFLGFDQSIIRFFPDKNKNNVLTTSFYVILTATIIIGVIYLLGLPFWAPNLGFILRNLDFFLIFILLLFSVPLVVIIGNAFLAVKKGEYYFIQNLILITRLLLLLLLVSYGMIGLFLSFSLPYLIAVLSSIYILYRYGFRRGRFDREFLDDSIHFSAGNYLSSMFSQAAAFILPLMILNLLGADNAAYFYISFSIATLLMVIPASLGTSLFVEGSYGKGLRENSIRSVLLSYAFILPALVFLYVWGEFLLGLIGVGYAGAFPVMMLIALSSLLQAPMLVYLSIKKVQKDMRRLILVIGSNFISIIILSYFLIYIYGLIGVGYAFIVSGMVIDFLIMILVFREF